MVMTRSGDAPKPPPRATQQRLSGWGKFPVEACAVYRPTAFEDLAEIVARAPEPSLVARGLGRSYGDAALNRGSGVVLSEGLGRGLSLDSENGIVSCGAAAHLADLIDVLLPRGFLFPVTPGTKFITVGGAIAADVHGKNHHRTGSMSASLVDFRLLKASGEVVECSRERNHDLFWATVGGMGLTGIVLDARLRVAPIETAYMLVDYEKTRDLDATLERSFESDHDYAYGVAWVDCLSRGGSLGRSVLMRANHARLEDLPPRLRATPLAPRRRLPLAVPFTLPNFTLNAHSVSAFNGLYYRSHRSETRLVDCERYFYPLDSIRHWNRCYGARGVLQYQCLLPPENARAGLIQVLEALSSSRRPSFLAVLKSMGPASQGLLSFPRPGYTLALDLPYTGPDLFEALSGLDQIVLRHGGRVYLAKDACLDGEGFRAMYPELHRFRAIKDRVDPNHRFSSSLARRLGIIDAD